MKNNYIFIVILFMSTPVLNSAMHTEDAKREGLLAETSYVENWPGSKAVLGKNVPESHIELIDPFLHDSGDVAMIKDVMHEIEVRAKGYPDYSGRLGGIWSDVLVNTTGKIFILKEFDTIKATEVNGVLKQQHPQSLLAYPIVQSIMCNTIFPRMFKTMGRWTPLPPELYAQVFLQTCSGSKAMDWHQDPGEDYEPEATDFSLVGWLSDRNDPEHGWDGGEFMIRPGRRLDSYTQTDITTLTPKFNTALLFNNAAHSHAVTAIVPKKETTRRDLMVITASLTKLPVLKKVPAKD